MRKRGGLEDCGSLFLIGRGTIFSAILKLEAPFCVTFENMRNFFVKY